MPPFQGWKMWQPHVKLLYHPGEKRKPKPAAQRAKKCPGNLSIGDRPPEAEAREEFGHREMDTVASGDRGRISTFDISHFSHWVRFLQNSFCSRLRAGKRESLWAKRVEGWLAAAGYACRITP